MATHLATEKTRDDFRNFGETFGAFLAYALSSIVDVVLHPVAGTNCCTFSPEPIPSNKATRRTASRSLGVFEMYPRRTCFGIVNNLSSRVSLVPIRLNVCSRDPSSCNKQIRSLFHRFGIARLKPQSERERERMG